MYYLNTDILAYLGISPGLQLPLQSEAQLLWVFCLLFWPCLSPQKCMHMQINLHSRSGSLFQANGFDIATQLVLAFSYVYIVGALGCK